MSLRLLLDENISHVIAEQVKCHRALIFIESVHTWQKGAFKGRTDRALLQMANDTGLTLVTYDLQTIPTLLSEFLQEDRDHAGVIFIDDQTISSNDFGTLTRAIMLLWEQHSSENWQNRIGFMERPSL